jgi:HEAT repeat protein
MIAIQGIAEPTVDVMQVPIGLLSDHDPDVRNAARLASGALARSGRAGHRTEADAIDAALAMRVTQAVTAAEKQDYIAALGNSGGPRTVPVLAASLGDEREDIRVAAARSLRLVAGPEAGSMLATTATKDTSPAVREAALFAMGFRAPLTTVEWDAVLKAAREDAAAYVRNRAVTLLRNDAARPPEATDALEWVALHDPSDAIRRTATTALAAIR